MIFLPKQTWEKHSRLISSAKFWRHANKVRVRSKISAAYSRTGKMERPTRAKCGRKSKVTPEINGFLQAAVAAQADLTLAELKGRLALEHGLCPQLRPGRIFPRSANMISPPK